MPGPCSSYHRWGASAAAPCGASPPWQARPAGACAPSPVPVVRSSRLADLPPRPRGGLGEGRPLSARHAPMMTGTLRHAYGLTQSSPTRLLLAKSLRHRYDTAASSWLQTDACGCLILRPMLIEPTAPDTALVGRAQIPVSFGKGGAADELDSLFTDDPFVALFPTHGHTILLVAQGLSDRHPANAVLSRIAWMHVQHPELTECGFDASALHAFRARLIAGAAEAHDPHPPPEHVGRRPCHGPGN